MNLLADLFCCLHVTSTPHRVQELPNVKAVRKCDQILEKLFFDTLKQGEKSSVVQSLLEVRKSLATTSSSYDLVREQVRRVEQLSPFSSRQVFVSNWRAWALVTEASLVESNTFLQRGIGYLVENGAFQQGWLAQLLPPAAPGEVVRRIYSAIENAAGGKKITALYSRMQVDASIDRLALSKAGLLALAVFGAIGLEQGKCERGKYYKKERFGLPRSLQWDYRKKVFYILSKSHAGEVISLSSYKRVAKAVRVGCFAKWPIVEVAQAVNRHAVDAPALEQEVASHLRLYERQPEGIWPIWHACGYKKAAADKQIVSKHSFIGPLADGTFVDLFRNATLKTAVEAIRQVCAGICGLHKEHKIHGDLKAYNILFKASPNSLLVGLIDFGFLTDVETKPTEEMLPGRFNEGYYGSLTPTAPELLGDSDFDGDYLKVEMWALGHMLYRRLMNKETPWDQLIVKLSKMQATSNEFEPLRQKILLQMKRSIENGRASIAQNGSRDQMKPGDRLEAFLMDLLSFDPAARLSSQEALEEVIQIQALF